MAYDPLKEVIETFALKAAEEYFDRGVEPSKTLSKFASELPNDEYINRMIECTNHAIQGRIYEKNADLREEFPKATFEDVVSLSSSHPNETEKVSSVWYKDIAPEKALTKHAAPSKSFDSLRGETVNEYGIPEINSDVPMGKTSKAHQEAVEFYAKEGKARSEKYAHLDKVAAVDGAVNEVKAFLKESYCKGGDLFKSAAGIVYAMPTNEREDVSAIVDAAVTDLVGEHCVKVADYNDYLTKTASIDLNSQGFVVHRGGDQIILNLHTTMGVINEGPGSGDDAVGVIEGRNVGGYGRRGTALLGGIDDSNPYQIKKIVKPKQSRPYIVKGQILS